jgi:GMP synthase-like glutamine amidotransferase
MSYQPVIVSLQELHKRNEFHLIENRGKPWIISGGMTTVTSDEPWIVQSRLLFKKVLEVNLQSKHKQFIFGICFGAQMLAESYRENSVKYLDNPNFGISNLAFNQKHDLFNNISKRFSAYSFHYNQIVDRKEFRSFIINKKYEDRYLEAFEIPNSGAFGVQFHPEFNKSEFLNLIGNYTRLIEEFGYSVDTLKDTLQEPSSSRLLLLQNFMEMARSLHSE